MTHPEILAFEEDWEYIELHTLGGRTIYSRGRCRHRNIAPVESIVDGALLARLCLTCDTQLPA